MVIDTSNRERDCPDDWGQEDDLFKSLTPGTTGGPTVDHQAIEDLAVYLYGQCSDASETLRQKAALLDMRKVKATWDLVFEYDAWRQAYIFEKPELLRSLNIEPH